jgi:hypothetical protein
MLTYCKINPSYDYSFVQNFYSDKSECFDYKKLYHFKSPKTNQWYWVWVEAYMYNIYGIKFHLKSDRNSKDKYERLSNLNEAKAVINTCMNIMLEINVMDKKSSFGFIGSPCFKDIGIQETKRYKVYKRMLLTYFSDDIFQHIQNNHKSTYMMVRKAELDKDKNLIQKIEDFFTDNYEYFD